MKTKYTTLLALGALCLHSHAADVTWDITPGTVGAGDSAITGGLGTWNTTNGNWTTDGGVNNVAWVNGNNDTAIFGGTAGAVTLDADVTVGGLTFNTTNYNIAAGAGPYKITLGADTELNANYSSNANSMSAINAEIVGSSTITKTGTGFLRLNAISDSFTGNIVVSGGTLQIGDNNNAARLGGTTYAGDIDLDGGTLFLKHNQTQTFSGVISGTGILNKGGSGTLTLSGANTYTGKTIIAGSGAGGPAISISSFNSVVGGTASSSLGAPTTVADGTIQFGNGGNQRSSSLTYTGSGETTDRVMDVRFNAGAKHTISNTGDGLLRFTSDFIITPSSGNTGGGLTLRGSGDGQIAQIGTIPGILEKADAGTWTIGGANAANSVNVTGGTLIINGSLDTVPTTVGQNTTPAGEITVASGATLGGSGTVGGAITVNNGGTLSPGNSAGQFTVGSTLTLAATSNTLMELGGTTLGTTYDNIALGSLATALTYGGNLSVVNLGIYDMALSSFVYNLFDLNSVTPTGDFASVTVNNISLTNNAGLWSESFGDVDYVFSQSTGDLTISVIPEPSTALLGGLGVLALLRRRR